MVVLFVCEMTFVYSMSIGFLLLLRKLARLDRLSIFCFFFVGVCVVYYYVYVERGGDVTTGRRVRVYRPFNHFRLSRIPLARARAHSVYLINIFQ